ncbi:Gfo/Idh/MocA family protein [Terriglobus saanensis]|uniref:Oxidoreductase domain protein n=1 Tax=Terriglobus saanensis (strain ATCC BAA-1853 / DSM 23119 / SP1PR4) TaxID=401053 RepID=E8V2M6_TERSS|nr:Gfo/Idh/MocA family oxidoreductase [Terriglobus saanensis]ADV83501.1 oxidoreductase domain protein [Terriglobus saanensis SP1PR4]
MISRRTFIDGLAAGAATVAVATSAKSYAQILGANERVNFAIVGTNSRALAHLAGLKANAGKCQITHLCDVDSRNLTNFAAKTKAALGYSPATTGDFRQVLEAKDVDAVTVATPDHWHAPMAILGLRAGKHVYVEKPSSHNPREGELLVEAQKKYGKLVQVGNQHRSSAHEAKMVQQIHEGRIGHAYFGKAWYANTRASMGVGKVVSVPPELNWDLWQGPAPRSEYKDNIHPYNWHWLRRYGTGEALNNGTHETDVCRWALGVGYPERVGAQGGRYQFKDDWEFYDTLVVTLKYPDKMISWEGKSCQGMKYYGRDRGVLIQGTEGSVILAHDGYEVYDWKGNKTDEYKLGRVAKSSDLLSQDEMTDEHFANFIRAIRTGEKLHSDIHDINLSITSLQLANISWMVNRELDIDTTTGHVKNDAEAMKLWGRSYEKGWEPKV